MLKLYRSDDATDFLSAVCVALQRGGLGNPLGHSNQRHSEVSPAAAARGRRRVVWATGASLSRVLEVGVVGLEAELEERRGCQKEISARINGAFPFL